ncbi:MAG: HAMP domain-containing histidine kinase [Myxococcota bacterium]|nr:HAMP domain-containing histidine kinase [Deltaproteobacteria bacterium]MDQ3335086.1 HAMP domain-containing histidine kinase [Myxococcota bacterium]
MTRFIADHRAEITGLWIKRVATIPEIANLPPAALVDHMPEFLFELGRWVDGEREARERAYLFLAQGHALQRLGHGVDLGSILVEYQLLREVLLTEILANVRVDEVGIVGVNRALDLAISEAVKRFAIHREEIRDRFVSILGHDLRNPLMALTLAAETILATPNCTQAAHPRLAAAIRRGGERMSRMIGDLVDFALGQLGGGIPAVPRACDMGEICREAVDELHATHPGREVALEKQGDLRGSFDRDRVMQVISNLVANALLHGHDPIVTRASESDDRQFLITEVSNAGPPIPAEMLVGIFDPFRRGAKAKRGGLGLGLYIVQQITLAHGASCTVDSNERATTFRIRWPRAPLDEVPRP